MDPEFWHARWRQNQIGFHQREINAHLQDHWERLGLSPESRVFVPLCGKSRDLLWLRARGHSVLGVEISPVAVKDFFQENGLAAKVSRRGPFEVWSTDGLEILLGDFFALRADDVKDCDGVYDRASLIALPPAMRELYVGQVEAIFPSRLPTLLVTLEYAQEQMKGPPFAVHEDEVRALYESAHRVQRLFASEVLDENPQFRNKGLTGLVEKVYRLTRCR